MLLRIVTIILLLLHTNVSLLMPSVDEDDVYVNGVEQDDINSFTEYFYQIVLGHKDDTPEDEDDDKAQYYSLSSPVQVKAIISCVYTIQQARPVYTAAAPVKWYGKYTETAYGLVTSEIPVPPPEA